MPFEGDKYIHLPNPEHPESDFRRLGNGNLNIVATQNFGRGIKARIGLLKGTNDSTAVVVYLFDKTKWGMATAKKWIKNHTQKGSGYMEVKSISGSFNFVMPFKKAQEEEDGYYYLEYALSTTDPDLINDQITEECIDDMIKQAPKLNSFMSHNYDKVIGPIIKSWKEVTEKATEMWIKVRVKPSMRKEIEEDINTGVRYGGSIGGEFIKGYQEGEIRKIEKVQLMEGSLTTMPMNWATSGSARQGIAKGCPNNICTQILKSADIKFSGKDIGVDSIPNMELIKEINKISLELKAVTMLPGWPEELDSVIDTDKAQLMDTLGTLVNNLIRLVEDIIKEEGISIEELQAVAEAA
ncbi:MAG: Caudovirus prohead protease [Candidatus Methanofastidiosum methylothiophilum]|uniref:Caudovirus prohead protease n=1 Tax=Candidatus Methanofastidiosum methylothiophilum TaxID=1705564 RepID=A0A150J352_9EURY|nr:MAG: Caudovirus prohead protease [Candidatus Methanofastidiosum methylthiophilus]